MNIRHHVELSEAERCELTALVGSGKHYAGSVRNFVCGAGLAITL